jgi:hypothetical protein
VQIQGNSQVDSPDWVVGESQSMKITKKNTKKITKKGTRKFTKKDTKKVTDDYDEEMREIFARLSNKQD